MQSTGLCKLTASGARVGICDATGTCLPCIPLFSFLNETRGPMSYGRKQEGGRRTRTVRSYAHRSHPHHDLPWFSFFFFCFAELTFIILVVCCSPRLAAPGPQMKKISEQRPTSEVNVNILFEYPHEKPKFEGRHRLGIVRRASCCPPITHGLRPLFPHLLVLVWPDTTQEPLPCFSVGYTVPAPCDRISGDPPKPLLPVESPWI